jgi:peptide subunit release factor 1 (eRF1)
MVIQPINLKEFIQQTRDSTATLSLYLNVDPATAGNQAVHPAWRTWMKNAFRDIEQGLQPEQTAVWQDIRARVESYLDHYMPVSKGLALFFGPGWEQTYDVPLTVENRAAFGTPFLTPLLWIMDEYEPYLVVMVDHAKARFMVTRLCQIEYQDEIELKIDTHEWRTKTAMVSQTGIGRGNATDEFQDRLTEFMNRQYHEVAQRATEIIKERPVRRVILVGNEQAAHAVQHHLPEKIAQAVIAVKAMPRYYSPHEILQHVMPIVMEDEQQQETRLVQQVIDTAKGGGRACLGREAVMDMLNQQRIELLLAAWPMADEHLAQELPFRVVASGGEVELVHGAAAERLMADGGLAARLYYAPHKV